MSGVEDSCSFYIGDTAQEKGLSYVPQRYVVSPSNRSSLNPEKAEVPTIDMARLRQNDDEKGSMAIKELSDICRHVGFFQVVNHGICQSILDEALSMASGFFNLQKEGFLDWKKHGGIEGKKRENFKRVIEHVRVVVGEGRGEM
ncbi:hypothetical protein COLO4_29588 [Corchorus olitorius]|uniref:Non-haem dioxygenase N-terminal domain-containing protein n=1 Tax=Corchorus olitorius TaxID=93759 RepID=A0A1R3HDX4_9ROSI|nr:hypothetical protein COLO4_29588 [Corchorus olitorius]